MKDLDSRSVLLTALTIAVVLLTIVLSLAFAQAQQTQRVAEAATDRRHAADAAGIAAFTQTQVESALLFTAAAAAGVADDAQKTQALDTLRDTGVVYAESSNPALIAERKVVTSSISELLDLLEAGDTDAARALIDGRLTRSLTNVQQVSAVDRLAAEEVIEVESSTAGRWGLITSFGVAVIVPAVALIAFRAIVSRRRRQRDLVQALKHESELNAAKDEMISNLSHELRTPLTGIYGFALAMEESGFDDRDMQTEMTNLIIHEAADLSRMVDDLLTAAKAEGDGLHFQTDDVDVAREVGEAVMPFQRGAIAVGVDVEPGVVKADRLRLRQVLRNLISNATTHGGPMVEIRGFHQDGRYMFEVVDDGKGVPDHVADRLFERFVHRGETPLLTGSIGLGLSIAEVLVDGMDGTLTYERRDDLTVFTVGLTATDAVGSEFEPADRPAESSPASTEPWWTRGPMPTNGGRSSQRVPDPPPVGLEALRS